MAASENNSILI